MKLITTTAYTLLCADEDRFLPIVSKKEGIKKFQVLHPIFLLRKQALEYSKLPLWNKKPRVVKVTLTTNK